MATNSAKCMGEHDHSHLTVLYGLFTGRVVHNSGKQGRAVDNPSARPGNCRCSPVTLKSGVPLTARVPAKSLPGGASQVAEGALALSPVPRMTHSRPQIIRDVRTRSCTPADAGFRRGCSLPFGPSVAG